MSQLKGIGSGAPREVGAKSKQRGCTDIPSLSDGVGRSAWAGQRGRAGAAKRAFPRERAAPARTQEEERKESTTNQRTRHPEQRSCIGRSCREEEKPHGSRQASISPRAGGTRGAKQGGCREGKEPEVAEVAQDWFAVDCSFGLVSTGLLVTVVSRVQ